MAYFHLRPIAPRPSFPADAAEAEGWAMEERFRCWPARADRGRAIAVGPVFDSSGPFGMALIEVDTHAEAEASAAADPAIATALGFRCAVSDVPTPILRRSIPATSHS